MPQPFPWSFFIYLLSYDMSSLPTRLTSILLGRCTCLLWWLKQRRRRFGFTVYTHKAHLAFKCAQHLVG